MAKSGVIQANLKRIKQSDKYLEKRLKLKAIIKDQTISMQERMHAMLDLGSLPKNSSKTRVRNRCELTGRPRGYYRRFKMSRIELRRLILNGMKKSSW